MSDHITKRNSFRLYTLY